jgi:GT2 family glycosyltransferase
MPGSFTVDAVICTKDRPVELAACLASLERQTRPPDRVLVVDAGARPESARPGIAVDIEWVRSPAGLPRQRNAALPWATADLVAFFDDDVELEPGYLADVERWFERRPECAGASGNIVSDPYRGRPARLFRRVFALADDDGRLHPSGDAAYLRHPVRPTRVDVLSGSNMVYRREMVGGLRFREELGGYAYMEDADFSVQAGQRGELWMLPEARLVHHVTATARLPTRAYVEEVFANSTILFQAHERALGLSRAAFARRVAGRAIAYLILSLRHLSLQHALGTVRGLRRVVAMMRGSSP